MPIENNIERIADALEALVSKLDHIGQAVQPAIAKPGYSSTMGKVEDTPVRVTPLTAPVTPVPKPPVEQDTPVPTAPVVAPTPVVAPPPTTPVASMTPEDLNKALITEFQRLGSRDPIDVVMRAAPFNAQSITDLTPEQYAPLIAAVQAVKVG